MIESGLRSLGELVNEVEVVRAGEVYDDVLNRPGGNCSECSIDAGGDEERYGRPYASWLTAPCLSSRI